MALTGRAGEQDIVSGNVPPVRLMEILAHMLCGRVIGRMSPYGER